MGKGLGGGFGHKDDPNLAFAVFLILILLLFSVDWGF